MQTARWRNHPLQHLFLPAYDTIVSGGCFPETFAPQAENTVAHHDNVFLDIFPCLTGSMLVRRMYRKAIDRSANPTVLPHHSVDPEEVQARRFHITMQTQANRCRHR